MEDAPVAVGLKRSPAHIIEYEPDTKKCDKSVTKHRIVPWIQSNGNTMETTCKWTRPSFVPPDQTKPLELMIVCADYSIEGQIPPSFAKDDSKDAEAVVRIFGNTMEGTSVLVHVYGFIAYLYVQLPLEFKDEQLESLADALNSALMEEGKRDQLSTAVLSIEPHRANSFMYYTLEERRYAKISFSVPTFVPKARKLLEGGIHGIFAPFYTFESNYPYVMRWMVDHDAAGCGWLRLAASSWRHRALGSRRSRCQLEIEVEDMNVHALKCEGIYNSIRLRILSFDIECLPNEQNDFPTAENDAVIQIACLVVRHDTTIPDVALIFTLDECASTGCGASVLSYHDERDMLRAFSEFVRISDPDFITGWNTINFDFPYLIMRAKRLGIKDFAQFGRLQGIDTKVEEKKFHSKQKGNQDLKIISIPGRVVFDGMVVFMEEKQLTSVSLNAVSKLYLGDQKEDMDYSAIHGLQTSGPQGRARIAIYCLKDTALPIRLLYKQKKVINYVEMARTTGVPIDFLLNKGQQVKVMSKIMRKAKGSQHVVPVDMDTGEKEMGEKYKGATVIEPVKGFYPNPVSTLDFESLYPSIMKRHNLCHSTLVRKEDVNKVDKDNVNITPTGDVFVNAETKKGLLPQILEELLAARKEAKRLMKQATLDGDKNSADVYNGRQLALKVSANSVYGFTGAQVGALPCLEVSESTTAFGRVGIEKTKERVESTYTIANNYKHNAKVIYGDTDSVMIHWGVETLEEAHALAVHAASTITNEIFDGKIILQPEKTYNPYLLMAKKRYAGYKFDTPTDLPKLDAKGIETERGDWCGLTKEVVGAVLMAIMHLDLPPALELVRTRVNELLCNKIDFSMLEIRKGLGRDPEEYDETTKLAHVELVKRMRRRDRSTAPRVGQKVRFVVVERAPSDSKDKQAKAYEKSEDTVYALQQNLQIDRAYYLNKQLRGPIERVLEHLLPKQKIDELFTGDHTRVVKRFRPTSGGLLNFMKLTATCLGCGDVIRSGELCDTCRPNTLSIHQTETNKLDEAQHHHAEMWTQCMRCQGRIFDDVQCEARDCDNFYRRDKAAIDLEQAQKRFDRACTAVEEW